VRALRNLDFYSGIIYQAMGFPVEMFPVLFAIGRMPGWLAQWHEILLDSRGAGLACLPLAGGLRFGRPKTRRGGFAHPPWTSVTTAR